MEKLLTEISFELKEAFAALGYEPELGRASVSNRPDLCEFQCNGALAGAKGSRKAPMAIAAEVAAALKGSSRFAEVAVAPPGFLNITLKPAYLCDYLRRLAAAPKFGLEEPQNPQRIIVDYGGANVAKPLHIGHLRSAIIGESVKRLLRYAGHFVVGDVHLGDWGLQMGLIIVALGEQKPELPYFDPDFAAPYPAEPPFTLAELSELYPQASARAKSDGEYHARAQAATLELQNGRRGYCALWLHIMSISLVDLKKNYDALQVDFDLWKGESDVQELIPEMVALLRKDGFAYLSEGALVVDVQEEGDNCELPPCLLLKSDGAALYLTTDLATILDRVQNLAPDALIYLTDKRQSLHFEQLFRCAKKTGIAPPELSLRFLGFGTMNGTDGKPFKTRDGGVMLLEQLVAEIFAEMEKKIAANQEIGGGEAEETARVIGLAALKYGDLAREAAKDYVFDIDRFTSFEGDTGPYILYTIVRIKSILAKFAAGGGNCRSCPFREPDGAEEKALMLAATGFAAAVEAASEEIAPHRIASYIYELANALNTFYHHSKILTEKDPRKKEGYIALIALVKEIMETGIDLLGFAAPERM